MGSYQNGSPFMLSKDFMSRVNRRAEVYKTVKLILWVYKLSIIDTGYKVMYI